jgi:tetratricopeptide (TPR) repeat protein
MAIQVYCNCGNSLSVGAELAGKKIRCKACGDVLKIPAVPMDESAEEEPTSGPDDYEVVGAETTSRTCGSCGATAAPNDTACLACGAELAGGGPAILEKVPRQVLLGGVALVLLIVLGVVGKTVWTATRPGAHAQAGLELLNSEDYAGARKEFKAALGYDKEHPASLVGMAMVGVAAKDSALLRKYAPKVLKRGLIEDEGEEVRLRLAYGWQLLEEKKFLKAHNQAVEAESLESAKGEARAIIGLAALAGGKKDDAYAALQAASAARFENPQVFRELAKLHRDAGKIDEARNAGERAVKLAPEDAELWLLLASLRELAGDGQGVADALKKAVEHDPKNAQALARLSEVQLENGDSDAALASAQSAAEIAGEDPLVLVALGRVQLAKGQPGEAMEPLKKALQHKAGWEAEFLLGRAELETGDVARGLKTIGGALSRRPDDVALRLKAARIALSASQGDKAAAFLAPAIKSAPKHYDVRVLMAESLARMALGHQKHDRDIRTHLTEALELDPKRHEAPIALSRHYLELLEPQEALEAAERGLQHNERDKELLYLKGSACIGIRKWDEAIRALEACQRVDPNFEDVKEKLEEAQEGKFYDRG